MRDNIEVLDEMLEMVRSNKINAERNNNDARAIALGDQAIALMAALRALREGRVPALAAFEEAQVLQSILGQLGKAKAEATRLGQLSAANSTDLRIQVLKNILARHRGFPCTHPPGATSCNWCGWKVSPLMTPHEEQAWDLYCSKGSMGAVDYWHELSAQNKVRFLTLAATKRQYRRLYHGGRRRGRG